MKLIRDIRKVKMSQENIDLTPENSLRSDKQKTNLNRIEKFQSSMCSNLHHQLEKIKESHLLLLYIRKKTPENKAVALRNLK